MSNLCAICQTPLAEGEPITACPECHAQYHPECWLENGGCAVYGCSQVPAVEQRRAIEIPAAYWGQENKPCPSCGREILAIALRCRHCGATFASAQPQGSEEFQQRTALESRLPKVKRWVVWLFVLAIVPCTAPFGGVIGLIWYTAHKQEVAALPALYPALSKIGIGIGLGQTAILAMMAMLHSVVRAH
jgi:hypothetical protein